MSQSLVNASVASSLQPNANRRQRHHHRGHDHSWVCHRGSRASQAALTNSTRLDAILMQDKPAAVTQAVGRAAVQGMGGVGKTSLAVEYAHRYRKLYAGVCWCPAETRTGLLSALASLAVTLGAATAEEADVEKCGKGCAAPIGRTTCDMAPRLRQCHRAGSHSGPSAIRWGARADHVAVLGLERSGR